MKERIRIKGAQKATLKSSSTHILVHVLLGLFNLLLLELEDDLEEVAHGHHHLPRSLLRLYTKEPNTGNLIMPRGARNIYNLD